jgi:hypothetical protein
MSIPDVAQLREIWGGWSTLAVVVGLFGAFASFVLRQPAPGVFASDDGVAVRVIGALPWLMGVFTLFLGVLKAMSKAYSGPVPYEIREVWQFDMRLAELIAFAFGFVFAFDSLRFPRLRSQPSTWVCIGLYLYSGALVVSALLKHHGDRAA